MKKAIITIVGSAMAALFLITNGNTSDRILMRCNIEALSLTDTEIMNQMLGIINKYNMYDYPTDLTPQQALTLGYANRNGFCVDPRVEESVGYYCANLETIDVLNIRYGVYCYKVIRNN